jgi:hypothetical protein
MLCQHLRFHETDAHLVTDGRFRSGTEIASGDLMCYKEQPSGTSCCVHLEPSTTTRDVRIPFATCEYTACITIIIIPTPGGNVCLFARTFVCQQDKLKMQIGKLLLDYNRRRPKANQISRAVAIMIDLIYWQRYAVSEPLVAYTYSSPLKQTTSRSLSLLLYRQDMRSRQSDTPQLKRHIFWQWF